MTIITRADLANPVHAKAVVHLLNAYAMDIMGGSEKLSDYTQANLIAELKKRSDCRVVLVFVNNTPAGLAICFEAFSTFQCAPIMNIHDLTVAPEFRGRGLSKKLLAEIEELAIAAGCCKITLEVQEGNTLARRLYERVGFAGYELDPASGKALFYEKKLRAE